MDSTLTETFNPWRGHLSIAGGETARLRFSWKTISQKLNDLYHSPFRPRSSSLAPR